MENAETGADESPDEVTAWIERARQGDDEAFALLVHRFQGAAYGYAYVLLSDVHLAQDATQESFLEAHRSLDALRAPGAFPAWLRRIVRKHCDRLTRRKQLRTVSLEHADTVADGAMPADRAVVADEEGRAAMAALESLPEAERAVTILHDLRAIPQRDVAAFLEITTDTVKNRLRSSRRRLAERMADLAKEALSDKVPDAFERTRDAKELIAAAKAGTAERVTTLLQTYPEMLQGPAWDLEHMYSQHPGWTPLFAAAREGQTHVVRLLLEMGANPVPFEVSGQYHDDNFLGWIDDIEHRGHAGVAEALREGLRATYGDPVDEANLHRWVREADAGKVHALLREKPERAAQVDEIGSTPLHWAVREGHDEIVEILVEAGAPIDARRGDGRTPALVAIFGFHRYWAREDRPRILRYLLDHGAEHSLLIAASTGDEERVQQLIRSDPASVNDVDPCGRRPLSGAVETGKADVVRRLLEAGADPNARELICGGGWSLFAACRRGDYEVAEMLLEFGAVPDHGADSMGNCIELAMMAGNDRLMGLLYAFGGTSILRTYAMLHRIDVLAEILKRDPEAAHQVMPHQWKPPYDEEMALNIMRLAVRYGARFEQAGGWELRWTLVVYRRVFRYLLEHGADPNRPLIGIAGDQVRRYQTQAKMVEHLRFLVEECGADVNCLDREGVSPLAGAAREGSAEVVAYLLSAGASPKTDGPAWAQPRALAEHHGHDAVVALLDERGAERRRRP